jgi:UDP-N-acetylmuramoylalanine--D-glutamate ligase
MELACKVCSERNVELVLFSSRKSSYEQIFDGIACKGIALYVKDSHIVADDGEKVKKLLALEDIKVPGQHNIENYMCAIGLTLGYVSEAVLARVAREFFGVEHRLELVRTLDGADYYNSSIDSSPTRTAAALSALSDRSIVLICGGYDKKIPYAPLAEAICRHGGVHTLVLTGATAEKIEAAVLEFKEESGLGASVNIKIEKDFGKAVRVARDSAKDGDAVLLSPASASFDAFKNFAQRGKVFKDTVRSFCED